MSAPSNKKPYRKRYLFPRTLGEVTQQATKPMMDAQGKLYGALIRDWAVIVGEARARICTPQRLQFPAKEAADAVLHIDVHPAHVAELQYALVPMVEQCARYFGYKAIERIVLHADYTQMTANVAVPASGPDVANASISRAEAKKLFATMRANLHSSDDK